MNYTFKNTEINNKKATDFETKSLLYLIGRRKDSKEVEYIAFDCFNDVSGINKNSDRIWDIQSKNEKSLSPKKIGKYFFTLFDNHTSPFDFTEFIFFCPVLKPEYKVDKKLNIYGIENIVDKTLIRIKNGLKEEVIRVKGETKDYSIEQEDFLKKVNIVEDTDLDNEYIKTITKFKKSEIKSDAFYQSVFQDLRDIQSAKKNSQIENSIISQIKDVLRFNRHLYTKDIEVLIISRIIGCEVFDYKGIPLHFLPIIDILDFEDKKDTIQECNSNLSRAFFNKNSNREFWKICEIIIEYLESNDLTDVEMIFNNLFTEYKFKISYLTPITIKYLIAITIDGKQ
ncbi:hypothetical protein MQE36_14885 [Zhouia spongiae]|uniref:CD-NTase associated protein 4-like DNA endonuclease domain-containing protein n=1 Tax=Zhouia spongiae TaxID=2202721 RepID=A0ABY3YKM4_9FLAO|nr:hypothetical protein [Zhouia spongiae]UNY98359.1 hypothetical protein MQE36_14885 [Zhouia spongiae]